MKADLTFLGSADRWACINKRNSRVYKERVGEGREGRQWRGWGAEGVWCSFIKGVTEQELACHTSSSRPSQAVRTVSRARLLCK